VSSNAAESYPPGLVGTLDVLAVIRAPLEQYPPSLNQVALMAEAGLRVGVVEASHPDFKPHGFKSGCQVKRFQPCRHTLLYKEPTPTWPIRVWRIFSFAAAVRRIIRQRRPRVVIAYDPPAMHMAGRLWKQGDGPWLIWHFHELVLHADGGGYLTRRSVKLSLENGHCPDLVIFPDQFRAESFKAATALARPPSVVFNCPRLLREVPQETLTEKLKGLGLPAVGPIIYFHGWIGPNNFLENLVRALSGTSGSTTLVLVGPVAETYKKSLMKEAETCGVGRRVIFLGLIPLAQLDGFAAGASVGVSLFSPTTDDLNLRFLAGASNKRFQYMAVGLPQVANSGPGMIDIIEKPGCGLLVNPASVEEIGRAITRLLKDQALRQRMSESARRAHLNEFNYENQFAPVLEKILGWCRN
jgi:glycosyltransferase involved in cell wall biosynthesis